MFLNEISPFHLAFPVDDLDAARKFYGEVLGCREGRSSDQWIDFDLFGHQIVAHYQEPNETVTNDDSNPVDEYSFLSYLISNKEKDSILGSKIELLRNFRLLNIEKELDNKELISSLISGIAYSQNESEEDWILIEKILNLSESDKKGLHRKALKEMEE